MHGSPGTLVDIIGSCIAGNSTNEGGGGVGVSGDAGRPIQLTIEDSVFADNQAGPHGGALSVFNGKAGLTNVLIYGNKTMAGPASVLLASDSAVTIMNSTIADNNPQGHQAILISSADLEVTNSIMWNNALNIQTESTDPVKVNYSDVEGECSWCTVGQGNIDKDPRFLDAANDDYRLRTGSPGIDAGTATGAPAEDILGKPRDGRPDMGAYEWKGYRIYLPLTLRAAKP